MTGSRFIILGGGMSGYATRQLVELGLNPGQFAIMSAEKATLPRRVTWSSIPLGISRESIQESKPTMASEDFGCFGAAWHAPPVVWFIGGIDADRYAQAK